MGPRSTKTTEEGGGSDGYDAHEDAEGRERHLLADTLGPPLPFRVTPADVQAGALLLVAGRSR